MTEFTTDPTLPEGFSLQMQGEFDLYYQTQYIGTIMRDGDSAEYLFHGEGTADANMLHGIAAVLEAVNHAIKDIEEGDDEEELQRDPQGSGV